MTPLRTAAQQALEALEGGADSWQLIGPAIDALKEALVEDAMQKFTDVSQDIEAALAEPQIDDPAIHFCHRFAILMECLLLTKDINGYWDEAHALLDEYNSARDKWMEAQGQPYVSGFGKD